MTPLALRERAEVGCGRYVFGEVKIVDERVGCRYNGLEALIALAVVLSDGALSARDPAEAGAGRGSRIGRRHNFLIHYL
jgi:hypothetical protein